MTKKITGTRIRNTTLLIVADVESPPKTQIKYTTNKYNNHDTEVIKTSAKTQDLTTQSELLHSARKTIPTTIKTVTTITTITTITTMTIITTITRITRMTTKTLITPPAQNAITTTKAKLNTSTITTVILTTTATKT